MENNYLCAPARGGLPDEHVLYIVIVHVLYQLSVSCCVVSCVVQIIVCVPCPPLKRAIGTRVSAILHLATKVKQS